MPEMKRKNYTELDIARVLGDMSEDKKNSLCRTLNMEELKELASNDAKFSDHILTAKIYIDAYSTYAEALKEFRNRLTAPQTVNGWINDVVQTYKELEVSDKVKLNNLLTRSGDLETLLEIIKSSWGNLLNNVSGMNKK